MLKGDALGEYSNLLSHVHQKKRSTKEDTKNVRGKLFGTKLF